jgi:hypothetical protein
MYLVTTGLLLGLVASGCQERNPAYIPKVADAAAGGDTKPNGAPDTAIPTDTRPPKPDLPAADAIGQGPDAIADGPTPGSETGPSETGVPSDAASPDTRDAFRDTRDARRLDDGVGPDAPGDAFVFADVARDVPLLTDGGPDDLPPVDVTGAEAAVSIDAAPACIEGDIRKCSSPGNPLLGVCHAGTQACTGGDWGECTGELLPAATELCNGLDDNCNGMTDEGCVADCVVVDPNGDDTSADGTAAKPFGTMVAALAMANAQDGGAPKRVCVAGGASCSDSTTYPMDAPLVMASGGRVQGNYALTNTGLVYCPDSQPPTTGMEFAASEQGVVFDHSVTSPTELSGFVIERYSSPNSGPAAGPIAAVTITGGVGITLSGIFVTDTPSGDTTYGVDVESGGQATLVGSAITGGQGRSAAIGVYVNGGSVNLLNNCDDIANGLCNSSCGNGGSVLGIRGRTGAAVTTGTTDSSAVYVTKTSPAKTAIVANNLCGGAGNAADAVKGANLATLRCESGACAKIAGNSISGGSSGRQTMAINLLGGASLLDGNLIVAGCGTDSSTAVVLDNASARLQNNRILGGTCGVNTTPDFYGVHIYLGAANAEPDLHSNTIDPMGTSDACKSFGVAVERSAGDGVSAGILRNNIILAGNCRTRIAVEDGSNAAVRIIENNDLYLGPNDSSTDIAVLYRRDNRDALTLLQVNLMAGATRNISADPQFVALPSDLHLSSGSPCIDRGTAEGAPATDGDGNPRPFGPGFDIGSYEWAVQ